ncbi:Similar to znf143: Zinc finger protein 143 (Xenopus tropicalis) [Cotesia congregata]|uniref:Similar to znf143: Zinc finger protein 143 (Xenopus tropicalis) n=1 Tax=Cotesia congregata TaxID=51543 RepID=A0A8J2HD73_COTCN|nr:Similar to znf143: Zinc finger protein 143 (Xenopus tropicalis) [Cotesia congregata]
MGDKLESHFLISRPSNNVITHIDRENRHRCYWAGCSRTFKMKAKFDSHYRRHTGERPFECEFDGCIKSYVNASELNKHKKTHYKNLDDDNSKSTAYECTTCKVSLENNENMKEHYTQFFKSEDKLKEHVALHHNGESFKCDFCRKSFNRLKFRCPTCGKIFKWNSQFKRHIVIHGKKNHACPISGCYDKFHLEYQLEKHLDRVHQKMSFTCHECGSVYGYKSSLKTHIVKNHLLKNLKDKKKKTK